MPIPFRLRQAEFVLTFLPERPFVSGLDVTRTVNGLFEAFGEFGLRTNDVRVESRGPSLAETQYQCWLFNSRALVTLRLDSIEIWIGSDQVPSSAPELALAAAKLGGLLGSTSLKSKQIATRFHGELEGISVDEFFEQTLGIKVQGAWRSSGASFEVSEGESKGTGVLEHSRAVEQGLFVQVLLSVGGDTPTAEAAQKAQTMFQQFISIVGLAATAS